MQGDQEVPPGRHRQSKSQYLGGFFKDVGRRPVGAPLPTGQEQTLASGGPHGENSRSGFSAGRDVRTFLGGRRGGEPRTGRSCHDRGQNSLGGRLQGLQGEARQGDR